MIRHSLGVLFWSFIGLVVFVNLFQISGALLPFEDTGWFKQDVSNTYFGFTSLFNFTTSLGSNVGLQNGLSVIGSGFSLIKYFTIDSLIGIFTNAKNLSYSGNLLDVVYLLTSILKFLFDGILGMVVYPFALVIILIGVIMYAWSFLSVLFQFLLGYYNATIPVSVILMA